MQIFQESEQFTTVEFYQLNVPLTFDELIEIIFTNIIKSINLRTIDSLKIVS